MDTNEMIALSIVALAAFLALRHFFGKKGGGCCGSDCLPKFEKKDKVEKTGMGEKK
ncbi:MAG: FeoB-associated Cys-rich membrane protein [Candidatus Omnitrophota bacterium]